MYMPYLHGKQEELLAVLNLAPRLTGLVVPIIKPVDVRPATVSRLARIAQNARCAVIVNSDKGRRRQPPRYEQVVEMLNSSPFAENAGNVLPAFEIRAGVRLEALAEFCRTFSDRRCVVVHKRHTYAPDELRRVTRFGVNPVHVFVEPGVPARAFFHLPAVGRVLIRDAFNACDRNSDYPPRSAFDDLVYQYGGLGYQGFGDMCMVGDTYSDQGGPAHAVALHLTEIRGHTLLMNHFVSRSLGVDVTTSYFEALEALVSYIGTAPRGHLNTQGVQEYLESYRNRHYPNLGPPKRWSIMHHIEVVQRVLAGQNIPPCF